MEKHLPKIVEPLQPVADRSNPSEAVPEVGSALDFSVKALVTCAVFPCSEHTIALCNKLQPPVEA